MGEDEIGTTGRIGPRCRQRGYGDDEAIDQYWNTALGGRDDRAADRRDLEPADGAEGLPGGSTGQVMPGKRGVDEARLAVAAGSIDPGAKARDSLGAAAKQRRGDRGRRGRVADAHFSENNEIRVKSRGTHNRPLAAVEGESKIRGVERSLLGEVAAAAARLVGDDARHGFLR